MKTLAELFMDEKNVSADVIREEIAKVISKAARPRLFGRELVKVVRTDSNPYIFYRSKTKSFPVHKGKSGANYPISPDEELEEVTVKIEDYWINLEFTENMRDDNRFNLFESALELATHSMARQETEDIISGLVAGAGNSVAADTAGTLAPADIADAQNQMEVDDFYPNIIVMHPDQAYDLKINTTLVDSSYIGTDEIIRRGSIPTIYGLQVWVTRLISSGTAMLLDKNRAGLLVIRQDLSIKKVEDPWRDLIGQRLKQRRGFAIDQADAICTITNC